MPSWVSWCGWPSNKLADELRRQSALKRDRGREETGSDEYPSSDPTPSAIAVERERWEQLQRHPDEEVREILRLRVLGYGNNEIADLPKLNVRKVQRLLKQVGDSTGVPGA